MNMPSPKLVRDLWKDAQLKWNMEWVCKGESDFMENVGGFLDLIGIDLDKEDFMTRFTTSLLETIYIPFEVGLPSRYDLWEQVVVLVHELVHVEQYHANEVLFPLRYVADRAWRTQYEAEAFSADMEMHCWRYGNCYNPELRVKSLFSYGLNETHVAYARDHLESQIPIIEGGASIHPVAAWAIEWLEAHEEGPGLRRTV